MKFNIAFFVVFAIVVGGAMVAYVLKKEVGQSVEESDRAGVISAVGDMNKYANRSLGLAFSFPKELYVEETVHENVQSIILSPFSPDDPLRRSSAGLMSSIVVSVHEGTRLQQKVAELQGQSSVNLSQNIPTINGHEVVQFTYTGAYSGETNYITYIQNEQTGVLLEVFFTDAMDDVAEGILQSFELSVEDNS